MEDLNRRLFRRRMPACPLELDPIVLASLTHEAPDEFGSVILTASKVLVPAIGLAYGELCTGSDDPILQAVFLYERDLILRRQLDQLIYVLDFDSLSRGSRAERDTRLGVVLELLYDVHSFLDGPSGNIDIEQPCDPGADLETSL